ncbi:MAG: MarR family winged helix-turn-helix transcriptional regulator [Anaerolineae bacterium]|nr:MarR family winged helix-turn-helix transcriptional regulator [Anaerolineae bacterium]MDW8071806.1 MarR family winged helix-turn-helix transcriptional regulator [Anaerolineae bacterium]
MSAFNPVDRLRRSARITIALYRISQAMNYLLRERGKVCGLSPAQIQTLLFLRYARPGVRTIGGLAERLGVSYATASGVADALEHKQLLQRIPSASDQRIVTLALTEQGERESVALEDVLDEVENVVAALSDADQEALVRATQSIIRHLQARGYVKVYEMCWGCQFFRRNAHPDDPRGPHHCAYIDAPLPEQNTYLECPDFTPVESEGA